MKKLILLLTVIISTTLGAQNQYKRSSIDVGIGISRTFKPTRLNYRAAYNFPYINLGYRYMFNNKFGLRTEWSFDQIKSRKKAQPEYEFKTNIYNAHLMIVSNWGNVLDLNEMWRKISLLGYGGVGVSIMTGRGNLDKMLNLKMGVCPLYQINSVTALYLDGSMTFFALGNWYVDMGELRNDVTQNETGNTAAGVDGYNAKLTLGAIFYLGNKSQLPADWTPNEGGNQAELDALKTKIAKAEKDMLDDDHDGIPNYLDLEPNSAEGATVDHKGRTINQTKNLDMDGDGVPDDLDFCPTIKGSREANGCPDQDQDGVYDFVDRCPNSPGLAADGGCPVVKEEVKTVLTRAMKNVQFENGKSSILSKSFPVLDEIVTIMTENPWYNLKIYGHTDNSGDATKNQRLSEERAKAIKAYFMTHGIAEHRLETKGYGATQPLVSNETPKGRTENRRVEFIMTVNK